MKATRAAGFTLIELLVALVLLALLSTMLVAGLRFSRSAVLDSERAVETTGKVERALAIVRRQIEQAEPFAIGSNYPTPVTFTGGSSGIVFVAPPAAFMAVGGEQVTWLAIDQDAGGARLVLRFRPLDRAVDRWPPTLDPAAMTSVVLIDGLSHAELAYFGRGGANDPPQWFPAWHDSPVLPELVRLSLAMGDHALPDLVVAPRINKPVDTGLLPSSQICGRGTPFAC